MISLLTVFNSEFDFSFCLTNSFLILSIALLIVSSFLFRFFSHSLGHGVGLETHEKPRLGPFSTDVLQPGMIVTIEPGLYYPGWGGARWEHMAVITEDGCRVL